MNGKIITAWPIFQNNWISMFCNLGKRKFGRKPCQGDGQICHNLKKYIYWKNNTMKSLKQV